MRKTKTNIEKNKKCVWIVLLETFAIILCIISLYNIFKGYSIIMTITICGIIGIPIYAGNYLHKRKNEFTKNDMICYTLMQLVITLGLFLIFILIVQKSISLNVIDKFWGRIIAGLILLSELFTWIGVRFYFKKKRGVDLFDKEYHMFYISNYSKWFTIISFFSFLLCSFSEKQDIKMEIVLSIGSVFCFYDILLRGYFKIKKSVFRRKKLVK